MIETIPQLSLSVSITEPIQGLVVNAVADANSIASGSCRFITLTLGADMQDIHRLAQLTGKFTGFNRITL